jgi:translocation and assembly module TamA
MKWLLAGTLFIGIPTLGLTQETAPSPVSTEATNTTAFQVDIEAPDAVRTVLQRHLELLRYRELSDLSDGELSRLLTAAELNTRDLLGAMGYFSPEVRLLRRGAEGSPMSRVVTLTVVPGAPTTVEQVSIELTGAISTDPAGAALRQQIEANSPLRRGMRFTQAAWDAAKQQALRQLSTQRYPTALLSVKTQADVDAASHSARLVIRLDSGPAFTLGGLQISGLQRYDAALVTRLARLSPGAEYSQLQLVQAQQRLADSGYFDSVYVSLDTSGEPSAAPVLVQVREARQQKLVLGIGASTDSGARLSAEHTHHKVPWIGWRAVSKLSLQRDQRALGTELTAPPDDDNWRWVTAGQTQSEQLGDFTVHSQRLRGGRSQAGERIDRTYFLQYDRADTASANATLPVTAQTLTANYTFTLRNFDSLPFPSSGWGLGLELGGGSTLGNSRDPFARVMGRWRSYRTMGARNQADAGFTSQGSQGRLVLRAELGAVLAKTGISLPSTQLFLTGGDTSVRGYGRHDIGVTLPTGQITAGRYLASGSVEWQQPIRSNGLPTDWEGALFVDAGAVADRPAELHAKVGVGAGVRWKSPIGPLQIDLAYGVAAKQLRLHMNVGFSF